MIKNNRLVLNTWPITTPLKYIGPASGLLVGFYYYKAHAKEDFQNSGKVWRLFFCKEF